jgi:hypothetical protein
MGSTICSAHVVTDELRLQPGASIAVLTATTTRGEAIRGSEAIFVQKHRGIEDGEKDRARREEEGIGDQ